MKLLKKLVRNRKKVLLLKAEKVILRTEKSLSTYFFVEIFQIFQEKFNSKKHSTVESCNYKW